MKKVVISSLWVVIGLGVSGCSSALYDAIEMKSKYSDAELKAAKKVKFMSERQADKRCKYISQATQEGVAYDVSAAQQSAESWLMIRASKEGANTIAVTDRLITKSKMTKKISVTANFYRCK